MVGEGYDYTTVGATVYQYSVIVLTYTEALDTTGNVSNYAQDLIVKNKDGATLVAEDEYDTFILEGKEDELIVVIYDTEKLAKYSIECKS